MMTDAKIIVPPRGPQRADLMIIGEAPGEQESKEGRPFVGRSGYEQEVYLRKGGLADGTASARVTNVICEYTEGNPDPTPAQIAHWTPLLIDEIKRTHPKLIIAVGRFAMRWLLGESADLNMCQGLPHDPGCFDKSRADRAPLGCIVVPAQHPAAGMYDGAKRAVIADGYRRAVMALHSLRAGRKVRMKQDRHLGKEVYAAVTGHEAAEILASSSTSYIALDTEGSVDAPWSIQFSCEPGTGYVLRWSEPDFATGIRALCACRDAGATFILHSLMHDFAVCREMGLELSEARVVDTMYMAYLLRLEPQGLKPLAWRWAGMRMQRYADVLGAAADTKQIAYLSRVLDHEGGWPVPEPEFEEQNDGTVKVRKPWSIERRVDRVLTDYFTKGAGVAEQEADEQDVDQSEDEPGANDATETEDSASASSLVQRWRSLPLAQRQIVEAALGPFPVPTLDDAPLDAAVTYSARDSDATLRVFYAMQPEIVRRDLSDLLARGMRVLPVFEEMQRTGIPVSRQKLTELSTAMTTGMRKLQARISHRYFNDEPFNPKSSQQVATLIRRRGLHGAKLTKKGAVSTGKQAIEHLRYTDEAVADVLTWREHQHTRDMFCKTILDSMDAEEDVAHCQLLPTRTTTRRLASKNPNLLAMPKHSVYGHMVRDCFVCPEGEILAEFDLSQIESRGLAHESEDPLLIQLFLEGRDIHTETAATLFGIRLEDVTKNQRTFTKRINFGIPYGASGQAILTQLRMMGILDWDEDACNRFISQWMKLYKGAAAYFDRVEREVVRTGYVRDHWGMYRYLPAVWSGDRKMSAEARRHAVNHRIQGLAQGMLQNSIVWLRPKIEAMRARGLNVNWVLTVHDSIVFRLDERVFDELAEVALYGLTQRAGIKLRVPTLAEGSKSQSWGGL